MLVGHAIHMHSVRTHLVFNYGRTSKACIAFYVNPSTPLYSPNSTLLHFHHQFHSNSNTNSTPIPPYSHQFHFNFTSLSNSTLLHSHSLQFHPILQLQFTLSHSHCAPCHFISICVIPVTQCPADLKTQCLLVHMCMCEYEPQLHRTCVYSHAIEVAD